MLKLILSQQEKGKHMKLDDYLKNNSPREFSKKADVDFSTVWYWRKGKKIPTKKNMDKIKKITAGLVCPEDFYN